MNSQIRAVVTALVLTLPCMAAFAQSGENVREEHDGVKSIDVSTVSGDCIVQTHGSDKVIVELYYDVDPEGAFRYRISNRRGKLVIKERWGHGSSSGDVLWALTIPEGTEIEFSSASGDLEASGPLGSVETSTASGDIEIEGVIGDVEISTASGDVTIARAEGEKDISTASGDIHLEYSGGDVELSTASGKIKVKAAEGDLDFSTASGDIDVVDSRGAFELSCASGEITAKSVIIEDASSFSTASGEVEVILAETSKHDLELSTASGDVTLDYNGSTVEGFFEFEARKRRGRITCPFDFDTEEEFEVNGRTYVRNTFTRNGDLPEVILHTASGSIVLKK